MVSSLISYADRAVLREDLLNQLCSSENPDLVRISRVILELQDAKLIETWVSEAPRRKLSYRAKVLGIDQQEVASEYLAEFESSVRPEVRNGPELTSRYVDARSDFWHLCVAQMFGSTGILDTKGHSELVHMHELYKHNIVQKKFVFDLFDRVGVRNLHFLSAQSIYELQKISIYLRKELDNLLDGIILQPDPPEKVVSRIIDAVHGKYVESLNEAISEKSLGNSTVESVVDVCFDITGHFLPGLGLLPAISKYANRLHKNDDIGLMLYLTKLGTATITANQLAHNRS